MNRVEIYDKNTLLVYLINELSDQCNYRVTTVLNKDECWTGKVIIEETTQEHESEKYYLALAEGMKRD